MNKILASIVLAAVALLVAPFATAATNVEIYQWPPVSAWPSGLTPWNVVGDGTNTGVIRVRPTDGSADWQDIAVFQHQGYHWLYDGGNYDGYTAFGANGSVDIQIVYSSSLNASTVVLPSRLNITNLSYTTTSQSNDTVTFTLPTNANVLFCPNGNTSQSLAIFDNPVSIDSTSNGTNSNYEYYAPGSVGPWRNTGAPNIYVAPGAIMNLAGTKLSLTGSMTLTGYGIILQNRDEQLMNTYGGNGVTVSGVILDNQSYPPAAYEPGHQGNWTWDAGDSTNVTADNVKFFSQSLAEDGLDIDRGSYYTVKNCFFHVEDDGVALKAANYNYTNQGNPPPQNITIRNNFFVSNAWGNPVHIGAYSPDFSRSETYSTANDNFFRNITITDNDATSSFALNGNTPPHPGSAMVQINTDGGASVYGVTVTNFYSDYSYYMTPLIATTTQNASFLPVPGSISNVTMTNIQLNNTGNYLASYISGFNSSATVSNVTFTSMYHDGILYTNPSDVFYLADSYNSAITLSTGNTGNTGGTLFSNGFESTDTAPTWLDSPDAAYNSSPYNVTGYLSTVNPECSPRSEQAHSGSSALMYAGTASGASTDYCYYRVFQVNIPVDSSTALDYWIYPQQDNGRYVGVDFVCASGKTLRDSGAVDQNGISVHPNAGHGGTIPLNSWSEIRTNFGQQLAGETIVKIMVAYDRPNSSGQYRGYIDDIVIGDNLAAPSMLVHGSGNLTAGSGVYDYGSLNVGNLLAHTFTIQNNGSSNLTLTGSPLVTIGGANASEFTVTAQPSSKTVAPGSSTTFTVNFTPKATGIRSATVTIPSNDPDTSPYTYTVKGTGVATGSLSGTVGTSTTTVNLTTVGTTDWAHWGYNGAPGLTKYINSTQISAYTVVGSGTVSAYTNDLRGMTWTNGNSPASVTNTKTGVYIAGNGKGFSLSVPASTTSHTLTVYVGGWQSSGKFTAHLSDGSAPDYVYTTPSTATGQYVEAFTVPFKAGTSGATLTVTWQQTSAGGNVTLNAAALK